MAAHITKLCHQHGILVRPHSSGGRASVSRRIIWIRPVKSAVTYAMALHELGHILGKQPARRIDRELAAWEWAKANVVLWDDRMDRERSTCLTSYVRWAERRQRRDSRSRVFITPDHPIYRYAE